MIVTDERVVRFVSAKLGLALCPPFTAMGTDRNGDIVNGVVFNCWEGASVNVTVAGRGWTGQLVRAVGEYVFNQLECERITVTTEQPSVIRYAERLGGQMEGRLRNHFGYGRDAVVLGILREEWRFPLALEQRRAA